MKLLFCTCMTIFTTIANFTNSWINPFITLFYMWTRCWSKIRILCKISICLLKILQAYLELRKTYGSFSDLQTCETKSLISLRNRFLRGALLQPTSRFCTPGTTEISAAHPQNETLLFCKQRNLLIFSIYLYLNIDGLRRRSRGLWYCGQAYPCRQRRGGRLHGSVL